MKRLVSWLVCSLVAAGAFFPIPPAAYGADDELPAVIVGRIYDIEGDIFRYVPDDDDWVATVRDAPFTKGDALYSGSEGRAELIAPNGSSTRIGGSTQIQFIALERDLAEMDVAMGMARFYNKGDRTVIKATSPFGYVLAESGAVFDYYVGENSVEVVALEGTVSFVHLPTRTRYEVEAGSASILADEREVSSGEAMVDPDWDRWNRRRDAFWEAKMRSGARSAEYLPESLAPDAYTLDENGSWETVYYEGGNHLFWRPTRVSAGWSPFTVGRWTVWYGDQTWIPEEPFGYLCHHYGNWVYVDNHWYWAPPVVRARARVPLLKVGYFWSPGRVSWIHSGGRVGWIPLAPNETYYSHRRWGGPRDVVVTSGSRISVNVSRFAYAPHAVVIEGNSFYRVNNYRDVRVANIDRANIINNYRAAPVVNNAVINNYTSIRERHQYTTRPVHEKPHTAVINRIRQNEKLIREERRERARFVEEQARAVPAKKPAREVRIEPPRITEYVVPRGEATKPKSEIKLRQKEIGRAEKGAPPLPRPEKVKPEEPSPARPRPERSERPETAPPPKPEPGKPELGEPRKPLPLVPPSGRPEGVEKPRPAPPVEPRRHEEATPPKREGPPTAAPERPEPRRPAVIPPPKPEEVKPEGPPAPGPRPGRPEAEPPARREQPRPEVKEPARPQPFKPEVAPPAKPRPAQPEVEEPRKPQPPAPPSGRPEGADRSRSIPPAPKPQPARPEVAPPPQPQPVKPEVAPRPQPQPVRPEAAPHPQPQQPRPEVKEPPRPQPARPQVVTPPPKPQPAPAPGRPAGVEPPKPAPGTAPGKHEGAPSKHGPGKKDEQEQQQHPEKGR
jgi:hypothetical protein